MADITLSKAVRSNLLNLQSTASELGKTQQRLATGLKVNSALDNPNNFFTASSLSSRAGDLGRLLDAVSNATQTIEAANNGLGAITKLVESAQATTRQALQTTGRETTNKVEGADSAAYNPAALTTVEGDNTGTSAVTANASAVASLGAAGSGNIAADGTTDLTAAGTAKAEALGIGATLAADSTANVAATGTALATQFNLDDIVADADITFDTDVIGGLLSASGVADTEEISFDLDGDTYTVVFDTNTTAAASAKTGGAGAYSITLGIDQNATGLETALNKLFITTSSATASNSGGTITIDGGAGTDSIILADNDGGNAVLTSLGLDDDGTAITGATNTFLNSRNAGLEAAAAAGDTFTIDSSTGGTETITFGTDSGAGEILTRASLLSELGGVGGVDATLSGDSIELKASANGGTFNVTGIDGATATATGFTNGQTYSAATTLLSDLGFVDGESITLNDSNAAGAFVINFDANTAAGATIGAAATDIGIDQTLGGLVSNLNAGGSTNANGITTAVTTGVLSFTADNAATDSIRLTDTAGTGISKLNLGSAGTTIDGDSGDRGFGKSTALASLAALDGAQLNVTVDGTDLGSITFGFGSGEVSNRDDLITAISALGAGAEVTASYNTTDDRLEVVAQTSGDTIAFADAGTAGAAAALGLTTTPIEAETSTLASLGIDVADQFVVAVDGVDYTVTFDATTAATNTGNAITIGVDQSLDALAGILNSTIGGGATVAADAGAISITSSTAGAVRIYDQVQGTVTLDLGLEATGVAGENGGTTDRLLTHNDDFSALIAAQATLTVALGSGTATSITFGYGASEVNSKTDLISALDALGSLDATGNGTAGGAIGLTPTDSDDASNSIVFDADSNATIIALGLDGDTGNTDVATVESSNLINSGAVADGDTISVKIGSSATLDITFGTDSGEVNTLAQLSDALEQLSGGAASVDSRGEINITSDKGGDAVVIGGTTTALTSFGLEAGTTSNLLDTSSGVVDGDILNIQVGTNSELSITFGTGAGEVGTFEELKSALGNLAGGKASVNDSTGAITIEATTGTDSIRVYSTDSTPTEDSAVASAFGLSSSATAVSASSVDSEKRTSAEEQFNELLSQIDQLTNDANFNGVNLLDGNDLDVIFNEDGTSTLEISGVTFDAAGLGLSSVATGQFQTDGNLNDTLKSLDTAIASLRGQATTFGSNLSVVETRQDFTDNMINTLETGAANLTLADTNEEAANLLALQTRQQLSSTALSLASQSDQNVLRLF